MSDEITPGERRELRSVVRGQFKVLRAEVKRRSEELKAEIEADLLARYRTEDVAVNEAQDEARRCMEECARTVEAIGRRLQESHPDLSVQAGMTRYGYINLQASNPHRAQLHRALTAAIPDKIGDANLGLDRDEVRLLRQLAEGALESEQARAFLAEIPTVGELVPRARLRELEES